MKTMNLSWLEDFLALAASGNFSRAADERHMTQPAFSRRIRALEDWLGAELFDRRMQPTTLTDTGKWFDRVAKEMLARAAKIPGEAQAFNKANSTTLKIASTHALSFTFMPGWLRRLEALIEIGQVRLVSDVLQRCEAMLIESQVQFLLAHARAGATSTLDDQGYPSIVIGQDLLMPVSAPKKDGQPVHVLGKGTAKSPAKLLNYSPESGIGRIVADTQSSLTEALATKTVFTAHLASVLRTMALEGRGIAWLPQTLIADDLTNGLLVEAGPRNWCVNMQIRLYRDKATMSKAAEDFWKTNQPLPQSL
jgi:LysR family transcriptional regulator, hypochlorite-specific transcription factor HypT